MDWKSSFQEGVVIPALPLALRADRSFNEAREAALVRYYLDAGAGGLAVAVHSTQFAIRDPRHGLFEPVVRLASEEADRWLGQTGSRPFIKICGVCGDTAQACREAEFARAHGYHAVLLSPTAFAQAPEAALLEHARTVSGILPVVGFYLQPVVGGRYLSHSFWSRFFEIENILSVKVAPFNRYATLDVVRAWQSSGRRDVVLYTGNDDAILLDLLTPIPMPDGRRDFIRGGLLGQWGVWTQRAVALLEEVKEARQSSGLDRSWLEKNTALTDINAAVFDAANGFHGVLCGIHEVLRRQGLLEGTWCLDPSETLSPGQAEELDRVTREYPEFVDDSFVSENLHRWLS